MAREPYIVTRITHLTFAPVQPVRPTFTSAASVTWPTTAGSTPGSSRTSLTTWEWRRTSSQSHQSRGRRMSTLRQEPSLVKLSGLDRPPQVAAARPPRRHLPNPSRKQPLHPQPRLEALPSPQEPLLGAPRLWRQRHRLILRNPRTLRKL